MIGKPVALIQVPNQRLFSTKAATQYLGVHPDTLRKYADLGHSPIRSPRSFHSLRRKLFTARWGTALDSLPVG